MRSLKLNQVTSLQLHWHSKDTRPLDIQMSIRPLDEQKCPLDIQMYIRPLDEWKLSDGRHFSLLSTCGQAQPDYAITASLAS